MPSPAEGLTFGDFTAEEWEKFFKRPADEFGNSPPVEFLFEFEYSDDEEPTSYDGSGEKKVCEESFGTARNVTAGPEDSGVEVGHESEQEIPAAELAKQMGGAKSDGQSKTGNEVKEMVEQEVKQDVSESTYGQNRGPQQVVFTGSSIAEETDQAAKKGNSPSGPSSPESDSFPPLSSAVVGHIEKPVDKPENERSRKRRRRRKQRKRSGSVSSSSSEGSEKERGSVSGGSVKNKGVGNVLLAEKEASQKEKEWKETEHNSADEKLSQRRKDSSSGDRAVERKTSSSTGDSSNSPTQSDTDLKTTTESVQCEIASCEDQENAELHVPDAEQQSAIKPDEEVSVKKDPPKPLSWADLFKNAPRPSSGVVVIKAESSVGRVETRSSATKKAEEPVQTTVAVHEDKHSKRLAEIIQKVELDYHQKPYIPRGLTNRGNWCYVNATLQALVGCSPFFNLLKELPLINERGPTSTPILDSLTHFMSEFKSLPAKPAPNARMLSKAGFNTGEPWEPTHVYKMLSLIQSSLSIKGRQEDAQEFLSCMLNGMHEEMLQLAKIVSSPGKVQEQPTDFKVLAESEDIAVNGETSPKEEDDDGDWEQVGPRNKSMVTRMASYPQSLISNIFGGYLRSSVYQTGLKDSANVEPFFELHLDVQTVASIEEALKNLVLKEEVQGYTCAKTKTQVDVSRRVTLEELPKVLILHLKRFIYSKSGSQKLHKVIDYPLDLTIGKELLSPNVRNKYPVAQKTYKLFAVVYHHGKNAWGGHYTTDIRHPVYGWVRADDTKLKVVPTNYVLKPTQGKDPYLLFYRRTDLMPF